MEDVVGFSHHLVHRGGRALQRVDVEMGVGVHGDVDGGAATYASSDRNRPRFLAQICPFSAIHYLRGQGYIMTIMMRRKGKDPIPLDARYGIVLGGQRVYTSDSLEGIIGFLKIIFFRNHEDADKLTPLEV